MPRLSLNAEDDKYMKMVTEALLSAGLESPSQSSSTGDSAKVSKVTYGDTVNNLNID